MKHFSIWKIDNKTSDKGPDYRISTKVGDKYEDVGAGWIKEAGNSKFISCQLSDEWIGTGRDGNRIERKGYHLERDSGEAVDNSGTADKKAGTVIEYPKGSEEEIPF